MPPKNKGKKGKKQDDEEFWEKAGQSVAGNNLQGDGDSDDDAKVTSKSAFGGFAALGMSSGMDMADLGGEEEEQDFGGLMSAIKASTTKPKKEKKKAKKGGFDADSPSVSFADGPKPGEGSDGEDAAAKGDISKPKKPTTVTAEDLADEEWGPVKSKDKKGKKGKKGKGKNVEEEEEVPVGVDDAAQKEEQEEAKKPTEVTAEELADEEWGPVKEKGGKKGKGKKGKGKKGKKGKVEEEEEEEQLAETPAAAEPTPVKAPEPEAEKDEDDADEPGTRVLSKKEKEKLKKERERAKKKAQAAAKKAEEVASAPEPAAAPTPTPEAPKDDEDEEDGAGGATGKSDKKKKKKKAKKDDEAAAPAPAPAAAGKKKASAISALKALMEEKKRLEEEERQRVEEERRRIEEEEQRAEEEARKKEEEKQRKKEKEKAKKELAKKEGRFMTKKQKEEKAAAEIRRKALLASGVQIEGLQQQQQNGGAPAPRKVLYGNRKKKPTAQVASTEASVSKEASPMPETRSQTPDTTVDVPESPAVSEQTKAAASEDAEVKDEWDADSDDEKPAAEVKDDWDASSEEEVEKKPKDVKTKEKTSTPAKSPAQQKATPSAASKPAPTPAQKQPVAKAKAAEEDDEDEDDDDDEDEDDSDDDEEEEDSDDDSDDDSDEDESEEEMTQTQKIAAKRKAEAAERRAKAHEAAIAAGNKDNLRSPICCILGHVDTGKTKLLDKIRQTNVQEGEAGGITQQIGATYFPVDAIKTKTEVLNKDNSQEYKIPGLLVIDTPGHESFTNLRTRGSSLCNIAILVVDIMHGLEQQTLESLRLLRDRKTPFIVALNKIDRIYGWQPTPDNAFQDSLAKQSVHVQREFADRVQKTTVAFAEQGLNAILYYDNKNFARNVSLVPTSAVTGEGVPDMIMLLVNLTQQRMSDRLMYLSELECTVLEVKVIEGLGTTIDVVLSNGILREGDKIVVCGLNGPIVTQVRALLTPQPLRELRIKSAYVHHKEVKAALGVKISAPDLEKAIAGSRLLVVGPDDDEDELRDEVMSDLTSLLSSIDKSGRGVCVQASTLGSLEALLDFLKVSKIPVSGINIGPVHKKDVMRCATMLEKAKELSCILCFDVPIDREAEKLAEDLGIRLFKADIIYHLFDAFTAYNAEITEAKRRDAAPQAIWPCRLKTIAVFAKRDPIILGVDILDGTLRTGTPVCVVKIDPVTQKKEIIDLGKITSLEINHKSMDIVKKSQSGGGVAVKIEHAVYQSAKMFGRHFDDKDEIVSHITRASIDVLKASFRTDVSNEEWSLIKALKPRLNIP